MSGLSFRLFRISGVNVEADASWFFVAALLSFTLARFTFPSIYDGWSETTYWTTGIVAALLLFLAVLLHEFAHTIVAKRRGIDVPRITLFLFGGVSHMAEQPKSAGGEFAIAVVGPIASLIIAAFCGAGWLLTGAAPEPVQAVFGYLALVNLALAIFNILPGFPMDGGRVLRAAAWGRLNDFRRATRLAANVGQAFGYVLMGIGVLALLYGVITGLWFMFIGWYLASAARNEGTAVELEQILGKLVARDVMSTDFVSVEPTMPLQRIVDDEFLGKGVRAVVVARGGSVEGLLSITDLKKVARDEWVMVPAHRVMVPKEEVITVAATTPAVEVLETLAKHNIHQVPVIDDGRMVGLISRGALIERMEMARTLGPSSSESAPPRVAQE